MRQSPRSREVSPRSREVSPRSILLLPWQRLPRLLQTFSSIRKVLPSSGHYAKMKSVKAARTLIGFLAPYQLSCENHPFFEGLHPLSYNIKTFYKGVLTTEGNIFEVCIMIWIPFRMAIRNGLWNASSMLEGQATSRISQETIVEVVDAVEAAKGTGVQVNWINGEIEDTQGARSPKACLEC